MNSLNDVNSISEMEKICFPEDCWSLENVRSSLERDDIVYNIEYRGNAPAGYFIGAASFDEAELYRIGVLPEYRRSGIGKKLMESFLEKTSAAEIIFLEVRESNLAAVGLYKSCGFKLMGIRKKYYGNENGLIFKLEKGK